MKIKKLTNTLHRVHHRCKNAYLVVFGLSILLISVLSQQVHGESVVGSIETKVNYTANGKTVTFVTRESTIANALNGNGITLAKNDITDPPLSTSLIGADISAKLIPAAPVLIDDNGQSWVGMSAYTTVSEILGQLKVAVDKADRVSIGLILDPEVENMAGQKITIRRAPVFTVTVDGKQTAVHSWSKNVLAVLTDGGIVLNVNDTTDPSREALAPSSGQIEVTRVNYADFEETVSIAFQKVSQSSYDMYKGQSRLTQQGVNGSKKQLVHVVYHNGVEVSREVTSSEVLTGAQNQISLVGVKPYNAGMWWGKIVEQASIVGIDAEKMYFIMMKESGGDPFNSKNSPYTGLFQYHPGTWLRARADYGGPYANADITNGDAQIYVTARKIAHDGCGAWPSYCY